MHQPLLDSGFDQGFTQRMLILTMKKGKRGIEKKPVWQGKRGIEKKPFQLPDFIAATGIEKIRQQVAPTTWDWIYAYEHLLGAWNRWLHNAKQFKCWHNYKK
ncbi:uncharacterized protein LOC111880922 isoform X1 [Lactuca sativa]|uniref:uncharacterized protein LOC111880922 isoform X1 n=1 Tax=Lactuca sativa TaxID=4236 RepID=UPI000CD7EF9E|nr:uncharacterized protein LOC111880922 isoform X1 [Lactuca sativa]